MDSRVHALVHLTRFARSWVTPAYGGFMHTIVLFFGSGAQPLKRNMDIDEATLMLVLGVASVTASVMFYVLHISAPHISGVRLWALGCLSVGTAVSLDATRLIDNWQVASLLFNIPFSIGQVLLLIGTSHFVGRPCRKHTLAVLGAIAIGLTVIFTVVLPDSVARIFTLSTFQAVANGATAWLLWRYREVSSATAYVVAAALALAQAAGAAVQALLVATSPVAISYASPELPIANIITWTGNLSNMLIGNWILFLLVMLRLLGELKLVAANDALTGLLNRRGLRSHIDAITAPASPVASLAVLLLDIDHFKSVNDQYGHDTGDKILALAGEVMREFGGRHVVPCRWGGEEFCFVVDGFTEQSLIELAEGVRQRFHLETCMRTSLPSGATVSVGVAFTRVDASFEFSRLVASADKQLYRAKNAGRNRVSSANHGVSDAAGEFMI